MDHLVDRANSEITVSDAQMDWMEWGDEDVVALSEVYVENDSYCAVCCDV